MPDVRRHPDPDTLAEAAAAAIAERIRTHTRAHPFRLVLAGGSTPRPLYERLAADHADAPWERVEIYWGDERYVDHDDAASNFRMARETLLAPLELDATQVYPMPTEPDEPDDAAWAYETLLRNALPSSPETLLFDLVLLGMGDDGHTASLFPGSEVLDETKRWVRAVEAPASMEPRTRLTLTYPALDRSQEVFFLVAGANKRDALTQILDETEDAGEPLPAGRVSAQQIVWWIDEAAAPASTS